MLMMTDLASDLDSSTSTALLSTSTIFIPQPILGAFLKSPVLPVVRDLLIVRARKVYIIDTNMTLNDWALLK